ncbi:MAG: hypothetical protein ABH896_04045 [Candidatus Jacksonbacteria bacterium]
MYTTTLQIPMEKQLRIQADKAATKQGFSSLQEVIRVFLSQFADNKVEVAFTSKSVLLSAKNDERYANMIEDIKSGKIKTKAFSDTDKLINYLHQ